jgi:hypothetical protein
LGAFGGQGEGGVKRLSAIGRAISAKMPETQLSGAPTPRKARLTRHLRYSQSSSTIKMTARYSAADKLNPILGQTKHCFFHWHEPHSSRGNPNPFGYSDSVPQVISQLATSRFELPYHRLYLSRLGRMRLHADDPFAWLVPEKVIPAIFLVATFPERFIKIQAISKG